MNIRPMCPDDWMPVHLEPGKYSNPHPLIGFQRREGALGNPLHPAADDDAFERTLKTTFAAVQHTYPSLYVRRHFVKMPCWQGPSYPIFDDYTFVDAPESLSTTSITVILVPRVLVQQASLGYYFDADTLPTLRQRLHHTPFAGISGNLGYYMTHNLVQGHLPWAHNRRFQDPVYHLRTLKSYLGFHLFRDAATGEIYSGVQGAHPAAVGVRADGGVDVLPSLDIAAYHVQFGAHEVTINAINTPNAVDEAIVAFTPGLRTPEVAAHTAQWRTYAPMIPLPDINDRINIFIANVGNGDVPVEQVVKVWQGTAPLPSFGAVLSFKRTYFAQRFGSVRAFEQTYLGQPVRIQPLGDTDFGAYAQMLGGLVSVIVDGQHIYYAATVDAVLSNMQRYANATSPIAQAGRESQNFDIFIREPAGAFVQTQEHIGWVLFDGRHELSIGASVVDVALLLNKLQSADAFPGAIQHAVFIDGGSAMKVYNIDSTNDKPTLNLLNRVAAGGRNGPGADPDGLNLYTLLNLRLAA